MRISIILAGLAASVTAEKVYFKAIGLNYDQLVNGNAQCENSDEDSQFPLSFDSTSGGLFLDTNIVPNPAVFTLRLDPSKNKVPNKMRWALLEESSKFVLESNGMFAVVASAQIGDVTFPYAAGFDAQFSGENGCPNDLEVLTWRNASWFCLKDQDGTGEKKLYIIDVKAFREGSCEPVMLKKVIVPESSYCNIL
ncbi:hypothetical protein NEOLI_004301 [Neolecta irregularis DAH-3]|uniref:Uncharacterized protein n=1 Tax=Neolecta irregularis (strain DAH-3) TaxID=1198029 RepID=A0A1U7LSK8_NEOID|nr:hypothetical protein NEOLI_004301 [Neolecta irregularis DAH-3]|eukprot:OLL25647.1 hypothetical protein NEOLI_004301 [Neolecta irregularis DAH-3]